MGSIQFFENVFDERLCTFLLANARDRLANGSDFARSNFHWKQAIRKSSAVVLVRDYDEVLSALILKSLREAKFAGDRDYHVMNYAWTALSYIPWHDDNKREEAVTIYLNQEWQLDWGGLFLYRDEQQEIHGYAPRFNCGLKNDNNVLHSTTPVSVDAPEPRFTVQLFSTQDE